MARRPGQVQRGSGAATGIPLSPQIPYAGGGVFNLNGIVALGNRLFVAAQSNTGDLWRIAINNQGGRAIDRVQGVTVPGGDGMVVDGGRLIVVQGSPAQLAFLQLKQNGRRAEVDDVRADAALHGPSTVAQDENRYLVVNADFATSRPPFTVAGLAR